MVSKSISPREARSLKRRVAMLTAMVDRLAPVAKKCAEGHALYEHDHVLPEHFAIRYDEPLSREQVNTLWHLLRAFSERDSVIIVRARHDGDDDEGQRLAFSTHPDTVRCS